MKEKLPYLRDNINNTKLWEEIGDICRKGPIEVDELGVDGPNFYYNKKMIRRGKSARDRMILIPSNELKVIQRKLLKEVLCNSRPHISASAYFKGRSIFYNAVGHHKCAYMFKTDVKDFFPSIGESDVFVTLRKNFKALDHQNLLNATRVLTCEGCLPQGAPTSPHVSNLFMREFDENLSKKAHSLSATYTRYADDITISSEDCAAVKEMSSFTGEHLKKIGLKVNEEKSKFYGINERKMVTGLDVTSDIIRLTKQFRKKTAAMVRAFCKYNETKLTGAIHGRLCFWNGISPQDVDLIYLKAKFSDACRQLDIEAFWNGVKVS